MANKIDTVHIVVFPSSISFIFSVILSTARCYVQTIYGIILMEWFVFVFENDVWILNVSGHSTSLFKPTKNKIKRKISLWVLWTGALSACVVPAKWKAVKMPVDVMSMNILCASFLLTWVF